MTNVVLRTAGNINYTACILFVASDVVATTITHLQMPKTALVLSIQSFANRKSIVYNYCTVVADVH